MLSRQSLSRNPASAGIAYPYVLASPGYCAGRRLRLENVARHRVAKRPLQICQPSIARPLYFALHERRKLFARILWANVIRKVYASDLACKFGVPSEVGASARYVRAPR